MDITHNNLSEGKVQSLGFLDAAGQRMTCGVMVSGSYNLGIASEREVINVTHGELFGADGTKYSVSSAPLIFKKGDTIFFRCLDAVSYICRYGA